MKNGIAARCLILAFVLSAGGFAFGDGVLRLGFIGDIMAHASNFRMADYGDIYKDVADILSENDLTFANLELPMDQFLPLGDYPRFNGHRGYWEAAVDGGVNVFSMANNHAFDQGAQGVLQSLRSALAVQKDTGRTIWYDGTRGNTELPFAPVWIDAKGFRVGFIAATQFLNQGGSPWVNLVDYHDKARADAFVSQVAGWCKQADIFIVSYHCGVEYSFAPGADLMAFFNRLLDAGVTVVWGHHPHVFQRWRVENGGDRAAFIMPSMGNFISGMTRGMSPATTTGIIPATGDSAVIRLDFLRIGTRVHSIRWEAIPTSNYINAAGEMVVGKLRDLAAGKPELSRAWQTYYAARLKTMEGYYAPRVERTLP